MRGHPCVRSISLAMMLTVGVRAANAQIVKAEGLSPFVKDYQVDFAVPDAPAFKLLQVDESAILRPQNVRDLTLALAGFRGNNNAFVVPKQLGVEASPGLLIGAGHLKVTDYDAQRFLYAMRFSGAASRDSLNRGQLAAGVRFSLKDEQDLRKLGAAGSDTAVTRLTGRMRDIYVAARIRIGPPPAPLVLTADEQNAIKALSDSIKSYWADHYWNATSVEVAFAARARAIDSLGHDPKMDEVAGWFTYANGLQGWGQLLVGLKVGTARDSAGSFRPSNTLAARFYVGSNAVKGFIEGQQAVSSKTDAQWLFNSGVELRLPNIGWINASAGYSSAVGNAKPRLVSSFKFKAGVPST
jgi:hypothetical protein